MNKIYKISSIILITVVIVLAFNSICLATTDPYGDALSNLDTQMDSTDTDVSMGDVQATAGRVIKAIRNIAAVVAVVVLSILGIKYMIGSTEERAEYKKSFIPLIVGIVVVVAAASIATAIFSIAG